MKLSPAVRTAAIMLVIVLVWLVAYPVARTLPDATFNDPFEKVFNGLNVLFTALAFGGLVIGLLLQVEGSGEARREEIERSIFELFQTFTSRDFQKVKDGAFRTLLAAIQDRDYAEFLASRLFVAEPLPLPDTCRALLIRLDPDKADKDGDAFKLADLADRIMLDDVLNFFAMVAQRKSSAEVIRHCNFAYDWWRPALWLLAELQRARYASFASIRDTTRQPLIAETLVGLDAMYRYDPLPTPAHVWAYISSHPKMTSYRLDPRFALPC